MSTTGFFITIETRKSFDLAAYADTTGSIVQALRGTLGDMERLCEVMGSTEISDARVEVEVMPTENIQGSSGSQITAHAVVQVGASEKLTFNKNAFTMMMRQELPFQVGITKRVISQEELAAYKQI
jgi:hypothetical protein